MGDVTEFKNWAGTPEVTRTGFGWGIRINGCDVFDSINQYGVKTLRSFDIVMGLDTREEAEAFRVEWLQKQLPDTDREAALREELASKTAMLEAEQKWFDKEVDEIQSKLTAAEQRNSELLERAKELTIWMHAEWGNTEIHPDCIRDLAVLNPKPTESGASE